MSSGIKTQGKPAMLATGPVKVPYRCYLKVLILGFKYRVVNPVLVRVRTLSVAKASGRATRIWPVAELIAKSE